MRTKRSGLVAAVFPGANISETLAKAKKDIENDNWGGNIARIANAVTITLYSRVTM